MKYNYFIFILLAYLDIMLDSHIYKCKTFSGKLLLMLHHIGGIYVLFGTLLFKNQALFHLLSCIFIILTWFYFKRCFYSIVNNKICGVDKHTPFTGTFHHIKTYFNIPSSNDHMFVEFVGYLFLISIYDIYLLTK
tara:strand:+ start:6588 stop:6992 length:405 start_codon:yes stop_codon:yes gene_type:complete